MSKDLKTKHLKSAFFAVLGILDQTIHNALYTLQLQAMHAWKIGSKAQLQFSIKNFQKLNVQWPHCSKFHLRTLTMTTCAVAFLK